MYLSVQLRLDERDKNLSFESREMNRDVFTSRRILTACARTFCLSMAIPSATISAAAVKLTALLDLCDTRDIAWEWAHFSRSSMSRPEMNASFLWSVTRPASQNTRTDNEWASCSMGRSTLTVVPRGYADRRAADFYSMYGAVASGKRCWKRLANYAQNRDDVAPIQPTELLNDMKEDL